VDGWSGPYDGDAHGASGTATGVKSEPLSGLDLGDSFTDVPGGTATWTFTDVTGNYNDDSDTAAIAISKIDATIDVDGWSGPYDGDAHGASGTATGVKSEPLSGLDLGDSFTDVPGGLVHWTFSSANYADENGDVAIVITEAGGTTDTTPPTVTITLPVDGASYILNEPVYCSFSCSDNLDPNPSCSATNDGDRRHRDHPILNGAAIDTSKLGNHVFEVIATDAAGNKTTLTYTYSVVLKFQELLPPYATGKKHHHKIGDTILLEWQYTDYYGVPQKSAGANPVVMMVGPHAGRAPGKNDLRYDAAAKTWIYTWKTKGHKEGSWFVTVNSARDYPDGGPFEVNLAD